MELSSADDLRTVYRQPRSGPLDKVIHHLDEHCVEFLARSPFFVLSTASREGVCDGSPKGGPAGFVQAIDSGRLGWADFSGNNRLDSFTNLVENPSVGMLFMIPGMDETLRVNGRASLVAGDDELGERFAVDGRTAKVVVVVDVDEAYVHCAKALRRGGLWDADSWPSADDRPSAACMLRDHIGLDAAVEQVDAALEQDTQATLWTPAGDLTDGEDS